MDDLASVLRDLSPHFGHGNLRPNGRCSLANRAEATPSTPLRDESEHRVASLAKQPNLVLDDSILARRRAAEVWRMKNEYAGHVAIASQILLARRRLSGIDQSLAGATGLGYIDVMLLGRRRHSDAPPRQLSREQTWEYWRTLDDRFGDVDTGRDPDGLTHSLDPRRPLWVNRFYSRLQRRVFERLLEIAPRLQPGARALDVGCGTGRWSRLLAERGFAVTGIDLAEKAIERNRRTSPGIDWHCSPIQGFVTPERFDLISCVGVLSQMPESEQEDVATVLRRLITTETGHLIVMEATRYSSATIRSRSISEWQALFERSGFESIAVRPFSFIPGTRLATRLSRLLTGRYRVNTDETEVARLVASAELSRPGRTARHLETAAFAGGLLIDVAAEPILSALQQPLIATHAGFLFSALVSR